MLRYFGWSSGRQRARAEAEHVPLGVGQREHDPPAEAVQQAAALAPARGQARGEQFGVGVAGAVRSADHAVPRARREADAELPQHVLLEPAPGEVVARRSRLVRLPEHAHVVGGRALEQCEQPLALGPALGVARVLGVALELDPGALGERLERGGEVQPLRLHRELEDVTARAAAEAVVELLDRIDAERRRALVVERAQPGHATRPGRP